MSQAESRVYGDSNMTFPVSCNTDYGKAPGVECPHKGRTVKRASMNWLEVEAVANKEKGHLFSQATEATARSVLDFKDWELKDDGKNV